MGTRQDLATPKQEMAEADVEGLARSRCPKKLLADYHPTSPEHLLLSLAALLTGEMAPAREVNARDSGNSQRFLESAFQFAIFTVS